MGEIALIPAELHLKGRIAKTPPFGRIGDRIAPGAGCARFNIHMGNGNRDEQAQMAVQDLGFGHHQDAYTLGEKLCLGACVEDEAAEFDVPADRAREIGNAVGHIGAGRRCGASPKSKTAQRISGEAIFGGLAARSVGNKSASQSKGTYCKTFRSGRNAATSSSSVPWTIFSRHCCVPLVASRKRGGHDS